MAAVILGHSGDVSRFASRHHYASYNGTYPSMIALLGVFIACQIYRFTYRS